MIPRQSTKSKPFTAALAEIASRFPGVSFDPEAHWLDHTSLGAGLAAFPLLKAASADSAAELISALRARFQKLTVFPLGGGTNLIGTDRILPDTVFLKLAPGSDFSLIEHSGGGLFLAGGALPLKNLLDSARNAAYGGAAALYGIPGTIGGAITMNAGANGRCVSGFFEYADVLDLETAVVRRVLNNEIIWGYRRTSFSGKELILRAAFRFVPVDPEEESKLFRNELRRRRNSPAGRSAGSVFKNPSPSLPAGKILEKCGAKQLSGGRFEVPPEHANWIVNRMDRKEQESSEKAFLDIADAMAEKVYQSTGIRLEPEVKFADSETKERWSKNHPPLKVLILKGGTSSEREISLLSAANVADSLRETGFDVSEYDIQTLKITPAMREADVVYPVLHGGFGEDGTLQKLLEDAGIPAVGAPSSAMRTVMDKAAAKKVMDSIGVNTPHSLLLSDPAAPFPEGFSCPLIVKPNSEGSTFGLTLVEDPSQWGNALRTALQFDKAVLVEEFIDGVEATAGVLFGKALELVEIRYPGKIYDYDAKYTHAQGETRYLCPPEGISPAAQARAKESALRFAKATGAETLLRVDMIIRASDDRVFVLEGNSMPGCTASSLLPKAAAASGIPLPELHAGLVHAALQKKRKNL